MEKTITTTELTGILQAGDPVTLLDVRRKDDFDKAPQTFASAQWKNPAEIDQWLPTVPGSGHLLCSWRIGQPVSSATAG